MIHQIERDLAVIKEFIQQQKVNVKETFTLAEAAIYLGVSTSLLYKLASKRKLSHFKPGSKLIFFKKKDLDDWVTVG